MSRENELKRPLEIALVSNATVLITGPTGSGKSHLARWIHDHGTRSGKPFAMINLATVHEGTIESELFGHERGAFTGADQRRVGRLEAAQGGTVFLDEIGELPLRLQARLLEFLQSKTVSPLGGNREIKLDVRIIAATHRDLSSLVKQGLFREDLFHRLRIVSMRLKSLVERRDEFDRLLHDCLADLTAQANRSVLRISESAAEKLESYDWPGNFRELRNVLEYAVLASSGNEIRLADLPPWFSEQAPSLTFQVAAGSVPMNDYQAALSAFEKEYLASALQRYRGRLNHTARKIGINKATLIRRMRAYGLYERRETEALTASVS